MSCTKIEPELRQRIAKRGLGVTEAPGEPVDEGPHGVDGEGSGRGVRRILAEVDRRELVEAHRVVRDHDLGRHLGELAAHLVELGADLGLSLGLRLCLGARLGLEGAG